MLAWHGKKQKNLWNAYENTAGGQVRQLISWYGVRIPWTKLARRMNCPQEGSSSHESKSALRVHALCGWTGVCVCVCVCVCTNECGWWSWMLIQCYDHQKIAVIYTSRFSSTRIWVIWRKVFNPEPIDMWWARNVCQIMVNLDCLASDK